MAHRQTPRELLFKKRLPRGNLKWFMWRRRAQYVIGGCARIGVKQNERMDAPLSWE